MPLTFNEICTELTRLDETTLLEVLDITSDEIVNKFQDKIEEQIESLQLSIEENKEDFINYE